MFTLEKEVMSAFDANCLILIQMDANVKVGTEFMKGDPHKQTENGKLMMEFLAHQNIYLLNGADKCVITRYRKTINSEEKAVLYYSIGCCSIFRQLR